MEYKEHQVKGTRKRGNKANKQELLFETLLPEPVKSGFMEMSSLGSRFGFKLFSKNGAENLYHKKRDELLEDTSSVSFHIFLPFSFASLYFLVFVFSL